MNRKQLIEQIQQKKSFLCVGLDSDFEKLPKHLTSEAQPVVAFNKAIIEATKDYCIAYKINTAFYESRGLAGWQDLEATIQLIPNTHLIIADAKRGDIGNTSNQYAKAFFQTLGCDAITVAPYMGEDSLSPFLAFENKWTIVLALTSNQGARDFQLENHDGTYLYETILKKVSRWGTEENLMYVIGASQAIELQNVRKIVPNHFLLIPGVGAQGGSLADVYRYGANRDCSLLVNASRSILFASSGEDFAEAAAQEAKNLQQEMASLLESK